MTGSFGFTTGNVSIPLSNDPTLTLSAPFTVGGGFNTINGAFSFTFSGTGTAIATLNRYDFTPSGLALYRLSSITYTFVPPVPEPGSLALISLGVTGLVVRRLRQCK